MRTWLLRLIRLGSRYGYLATKGDKVWVRAILEFGATSRGHSLAWTHVFEGVPLYHDACVFQ